MTNTERTNFVNSAPIDSGLKEAVLYLLQRDTEHLTKSGIRLKNQLRGNVLPEVQKGDLWIKNTTENKFEALAYLGHGDAENTANYQLIGGWEMENIN